MAETFAVNKPVLPEAKVWFPELNQEKPHDIFMFSSRGEVQTDLGVSSPSWGEPWKVPLREEVRERPEYTVSWPSEVFRFSGMKKSGLYLDTGAAQNLSGDEVLLDHEKRIYDASKDPNLCIRKENCLASFAGIDGPGTNTYEAWSIPIFMGNGLGAACYRASVIPNSSLPSLLCLAAMRVRASLIHTGNDSFYIPVKPDANVYHKLALDWDGTHYSLPIDKYAEACASLNTTSKTYFWIS